MTVKFTNNANSTLASGINSSVTSMTVADASSFPSLSGANDYCYLTLQESGGTTREIVKATARSSNTFTVVRGQDNTSAATWSSGVLVELRITSALLQDVIDGLGSGSMMDTDIFAGDGSDTTFTLSRQPDNENNLLIFIDGVFQAHNAYSVSGTTLTLSAAPANGRVITAYHMATTVGGSNLIKATMTGDNSDTTLDVGSQIIHENNVQVYFDGVYQSKGNYSVSGSVITFSTAPPTGVAVEAILNTATNISTAAQLTDADSDTLIQVEESADEDTIRMDVAGTEVLTLTNSAMTLKGTTPTLTIGDAGAEDTKIVFDGNAQDYYIGLDDSVDKLLIGLGSTVGTTPAISIDENLNTKIEAGNFLLETSGKYIQTAGSSSNFWALGSTGGTGSPGTGSTSFGIHNYNGSAWSNPVVITNDGKVGIGATPNYGKVNITTTGTGGQDRALWVECSPASSGSNNNAMVVNVGNGNMTNTVMRIHHESPAANQKLLSLDTTGSNTEKFWVDEDGDVYLAGQLDVQGTALMERARLSTNDGTTYWDFRRDSSSGNLVISDDGLGDVITVSQTDGGVTMTRADNGAVLTLKSTDNDDQRGPMMDFFRDPSDGVNANGDLIGAVRFLGNDTVGTSNVYFIMEAIINQADNGSEDGYLDISSLYNGAKTRCMIIGGSGGSKVYIGTSVNDMYGYLNVQGDNGLSVGYANDQGDYRRLYATGTTTSTTDIHLTFWNGLTSPQLTYNGVWTDSSDVSLKKDIVDIEYGLETVKKLKPRKYKMKSNDEEQVGFIAQEVESEVPEVVTQSTTPDGDEQKGLAYGHLVAVLTKAMQEQQTQIEALQARIKTLEEA